MTPPVTRPDEAVWYVAYGSNLFGDRMLAYLLGAGDDSPFGRHRGAADPTHPRDDRRVTVPPPVRFGGHSRRWGGGVAWCPHEALSDGTEPPIGRAWRVTRSQLADIVAQENGRATDEVTLPDHFPKVGDAVVTNPGPIDLLITLPPIDGVGAVTLGSTDPPPPGPPSPAYRAILAAGLAEMGCTAAEITRSLAALDRSEPVTP